MAVNKVMYGQNTIIDISDTTAAASDVASGKYFYTNAGVKTEGTSSGGGGGYTSLKIGVIRPDAELVQKWSDDVLAVADLGLTLPAYSTSSTTLVAYQNLTPSISLDVSNYDYYVLKRALTYPIYSSNTKSKGRMEYCITQGYDDILHIPKEKLKSLDLTKFSTTDAWQIISGSRNDLVYWTSATAVGYKNAAYGPQVYFASPTGNQTSLTFKSPQFRISGNATYFSSANWSLMTDARYQWIIELYRVPKGNMGVYGWTNKSQITHELDDVSDNNGTLT